MFPFPSLKKEMICLTPRAVSYYLGLSDDVGENDRMSTPSSLFSRWGAGSFCWLLRRGLQTRCSPMVESELFHRAGCWECAIGGCNAGSVPLEDAMLGACHWRTQCWERAIGGHSGSWQLMPFDFLLQLFSHQLHLCRAMCFVFLMTSPRKGLPLDSGAILIQRLRFQYFNLVTDNVIHKFSGVGSWIICYVWFWE